MGGGGGSSFSDFFETLFGQSMAGQGAAASPFGGADSFGGQRRARASRAPARHEAEIELTIEEMAKGTTRTLEISSPSKAAKQVEVKIPAGVHPGSKVRVPGGKTGADGADIYLTVKAKAHQYFTLEGSNLLCELTLSPPQAVLGTEASVTTLDGPKTVKVPAGSQAGRTLRLRGRGLPGMKGAAAGDQLVKIKIAIPAKPTAEELKLYEELAKLESKH
jgi:curved DNA-binding protein